jgi:hypothetical protein
MQMGLFLLLNAILFVRPEDLWPELAGLRLYLIVIGLCLLANADRLAAALSWGNLSRRPVDVCVLGVWLAVGLSHLAQFRLDDALDWWGEFAKVVGYYFLLRVTLDTRERFRAFLGYAVGLVVLAIIPPLLNYYDIVTFEAIGVVAQSYLDPKTGELTTVTRLRGVGLFGDPNDLCLLLVFGGLCCLYRAATADPGRALLWLLPLVPFGYAFIETQSRGGALGLLAGLTGVVLGRYGWARAMPLMFVCAPALLLAIGGRQSDIGTGDTAHERVMLWSLGLGYLQSQPMLWLTGLGAGEYEEWCTQVAHNSFVQSYVETGLFGGGFFIAAFYTAGRSLWRVRQPPVGAAPDPFTAALPFVFGLLAGYAGGAFSLSRSFVLLTYLVLGIAQSYLAIVEPTPPPVDQVNGAWVKRAVVVAIVGALVLKFTTMVLVNL